MKMRSILVMFLVLGLLAGPICSAAYATCDVFGQIFRVSNINNDIKHVYVRPYWQVQPTYNYHFYIPNGDDDMLMGALAAQNSGMLVYIRGDAASCTTDPGTQIGGNVVWIVPLH